MVPAAPGEGVLQRLRRERCFVKMKEDHGNVNSASSRPPTGRSAETPSAGRSCVSLAKGELNVQSLPEGVWRITAGTEWPYNNRAEKGGAED